MAAYRLADRIIAPILGVIFSGAALPTEPSYIDYPVNMQTESIELVLNGINGKPYGDFESLIKEKSPADIKVLMNAGMFMENRMPLGLYIESGKQLRPLNKRKGAKGNFYIQPNAVFAQSASQAFIVPTDEWDNFIKLHDVSYATQSGPMLLKRGAVNLAIKKMKNSNVRRNSVCISAQGSVILSISVASVSMMQLAEHLQDIGCHDALFLDGAISSAFVKDLGINIGGWFTGPIIVITNRR